MDWAYSRWSAEARSSWRMMNQLANTTVSISALLVTSSARQSETEYIYAEQVGGRVLEFLAQLAEQLL